MITSGSVSAGVIAGQTVDASGGAGAVGGTGGHAGATGGAGTVILVAN
jgi:hypothetical protein